MRRRAAKRTEALKCPGKRKIKIVGLVPLRKRGQPASPSASVCPYLTGLLPVVQGKCNGRQQCILSRSDIAVSKKQCPGVRSVNFRVRCIKKGIVASQLRVKGVNPPRSTTPSPIFFPFSLSCYPPPATKRLPKLSWRFGSAVSSSSGVGAKPRSQKHFWYIVSPEIVFDGTILVLFSLSKIPRRPENALWEFLYAVTPPPCFAFPRPVTLFTLCVNSVL